MSKRRTCKTCDKKKPLDAFEPAGKHRRRECRECRWGRLNEAGRAARRSVDVALPRPVAAYGPLRPWGTATQRAAIDAVVEAAGDVLRAADALGTTPGRVVQRLREVEARAARAGALPGEDLTEHVPEGRYLGKQTVHLDADGKVRNRWIRVQPDDLRAQALLDAVSAQCEPIAGLEPPTAAPEVADEDLLAVIPIGDAHIGMLAWAAETGGDWDLEIAERVITGAVFELLSQIPRVGKIAVVDLGDWFHVDNQKNETPASGHRLDVDSRLPKLYETGLRIDRRITSAALDAAPEVYHRACGGNHDPTLAITKRACMAALYEREPRLHVDTSPKAITALQHGECLLAWTHGHGKKFDSRGIVETFPAAFPREWGTTKFRQVYTGHRHRDHRVEYAGFVWSSERVLAPADAYAHHSGYMSGRSIRAEIWHKRRGRVGEYVVPFEQLQEVSG